jgi:hypothetical protein
MHVNSLPSAATVQITPDYLFRQLLLAHGPDAHGWDIKNRVPRPS